MTSMYGKPNFVEAFGARGSHGPKFAEKDLPHKTNVWNFLREARGETGALHIAEALSTSDFDYILTTDMNAQLLAGYNYFAPSYQMWTRKISVPNFQSNPLDYLNEVSGLMGKVNEKAELTYANLTDGQYTIAADTYEKGIKLTRQAIVNDALNAFRSVPDKLGKLAAKTAEYYATSQIADANGPDATMFTNGHGNLITSELSYAALEEAYNKFAAQTDANGDPIMLRPKGIIVPRELEQQAIKLVSAFDVETIDDTADVRIKGKNQYTGLEIAVAPFITSVSSSNTYRAKQWYMYADPMINTPAVAVATLQNAPNPRIFSLAPDAVQIGGGTTPYSFKGNTLEYKVSWDLGFSQIDYRSMVASKPTS